MNNKIRISASAWSDHQSRLYCNGEHVDNSACITNVVRHNAQSAWLEMSDAAIVEFACDMAYQVEFSDGAYRTQCRNALRRIVAQAAHLDHIIKASIR